MATNDFAVHSQDIRARIDQLGLTQPNGWSFLPANLMTANSKSELNHADSVLGLRKLMRMQGYAETPIDPPDMEIPRLALRYIDWVGPTIFFSASMILENPQIVGVCVNLVSSYVYDLFRGRSEDVKARLKIAIERERGKPVKVLEYHGSVEGLKELPKIIRSLDD